MLYTLNTNVLLEVDNKIKFFKYIYHLLIKKM